MILGHTNRIIRLAKEPQTLVDHSVTDDNFVYASYYLAHDIFEEARLMPSPCLIPTATFIYFVSPHSFSILVLLRLLSSLIIST